MINKYDPFLTNSRRPFCRLATGVALFIFVHRVDVFILIFLEVHNGKGLNKTDAF